ncbi:MAG: efflux RND transporter periplasmic adaptor subunit [Candidatus Uhrbacteria bacterium]
MSMKSKKALFLTAVLVIGGGGTYAAITANKPATTTKYVLAQVTKGTIVAAISGSGQVSGQNQLDITPAVSGAITKILVKAGDTVTEGTPLFEIDRKVAVRALRDAQQNVRDAQLSLQSSELSYKKFVSPASALDVAKAQNAVNQAQRTLTDLQKGSDPLDIKQAQADLEAAQKTAELSTDGVTSKIVRNAYNDATPDLKSMAQSLRDALTDADNVLGITDVSKNDTFESFLSVLDSSRLPRAQASYANAREKIIAFKALTDKLDPLGADPAKIDAALTAAEAALRVAEPMLQETIDVLTASITSASFSQSSLDSMKSRLQSDHSSAVSNLNSVNTTQENLDQAKTDFANAARDVEKKQSALDKLIEGTDPIDIASAQEKLDEAITTLSDLKQGPDAIDIAVQKNGVEQRRSSVQSAMDRLADAQDTLNDYTVRASFDGIIVSVAAKNAQQVTGSTKLATLLTKAKMVSIALNEVDIANVKDGENATITFDALADLSIAGNVIAVDPIGTVSQGVVTYNVQVAFLTDDDRIKPGMSANVSIATDVRPDVLTIPNGAIKNSSVQILPNEKNPSSEAQSAGIASATPPESVQITTGLASDLSTEVTSGLTEGQWIITRTILPTTAATASPARASTSIMPGAGGAGFAGGGAARSLQGR